MLSYLTWSFHSRYAYSDARGEDEDEEIEALCKETPQGDIGLMKMDRKDGSDSSDVEDDIQEGKREWFV